MKTIIYDKPHREHPLKFLNDEPEPHGYHDLIKSTHDEKLRHQSNEHTKRATAVVNYFLGTIFSEEINQSIN